MTGSIIHKVLIFILILTAIIDVFAQNPKPNSDPDPVHEFNGQIAAKHIRQLAEQLFNENTNNTDKLLIRCAHHHQEVEPINQWVCAIYPIPQSDQAFTPATPPDTNDWLLIIDLNTNQYQLEKLWQQPTPR